MRRAIVTLLLLLGLPISLVLAACAESGVHDPPIPTITQADRGWVDTTGNVDKATLEELRSTSDAIEAQGQRQGKGYQIAGVFFNNIASGPSTFASDVYNHNGIGSRERDNGILIMVLLDKAGDDGKKPYIFVTPGRGLEGDLPDSKIADFREKYFNPQRAQGHWQTGLIDLESHLGQYLHDPSAHQPKKSVWSSGAIILVVVICVIAGVFILMILPFFSGRGGSSGGSCGSSRGGFPGWSSSDGGGSYGGGGSAGGGGSGG
jgi:uncharacterized protein